MENKLIPVSEKMIEDISTKLIEYLDFKDSIFENEFVKAFGDSIKIFKFLKTGHDLVSKIKFNYFLKGFTHDDTPTDEQLNKLEKYINNEKKAEFIADMFSKILMSNSKLACMVMGTIVSNLTKDNNDIAYNDLVCVKALTNFLDDDIRYYYKLVNWMGIDEEGFYEYEFNNYGASFFNQDSYNNEDLWKILHKSISYQLFLTKYQIKINTDKVHKDFSSSKTVTAISAEPLIYYYPTSAGKILYEYINKISHYLG